MLDTKGMTTNDILLLTDVGEAIGRVRRQGSDKALLRLMNIIGETVDEYRADLEELEEDKGA